VAVVLGLLQAALWALLQGRVPLLTQVALVLALGLLLSGGLHMDGAMDTADGLAAGDRCLEAMRDSRIGASGAQALVLVLLLKAAALASLGAIVPVVLPWAAFWSRVAPLVAIDRFPCLRPSGGGALHRRHWAGLAVELRPALLLLVLLLIATCSQGWPAVGLWGVLPAVLVPLWLGRRLGGHSGDSYGACVEWSESLALLLAAAVWLGWGGGALAQLGSLWSPWIG
jgi:adenosylcobinamide-GDP ribazoletransferase